jgi:hypothetical protein
MMRLDQDLGLYDMDYAVNEGGAYGHLSHPFEDTDLTMSDILEMIEATINGSFGPENFVQEKTDGQNIMISWKNGQLIAARNGSHLKNAGENALTIDGIAELYAGRGDIETVYNAAMKDLSAAIGALSEEDKKRYFDEGRKFASLEIITPVTQNTVPYGLNMLVFHGVVEHDLDGKAIGEDKQAGRDLGKIIKEVNADAQETFFVRGPQDMDIKAFPNTAKRSTYYRKKYDQIMKENDLAPTSTIGEYALNRAKTLISDAAEKAGVVLPESVMTGLGNRVSGISKAYRVTQLKKEGVSPDAVKWYSDWEKKNSKMLKKEVYLPLESLFIEVGTEFMKNMSSFLSANPTEAAEEMKKEIDGVISTLRKTGGPEEIEKLEHELKRVTAAGGLESIVPTEGITFVFKGKLYKYTGIFAPIHQIRSMLAYKK